MPASGSLARAVSLLALAAALAPAPAHAAACPRALILPAPGTVDEATGAVVCLINAARAERGLRPLRHDGDLRRVARRHAADMVRRSYFSHVTPGGADLGDRLHAAGYGRGHRWRAGEALGWGTGPWATPAGVVREWLASPPHRRILLDPAYSELGVGAAAGAPRPGLDGATYAVDVGWVG